MFLMSWKITVGKYRLTLLDSVNVKTSVETLADTATIIIPSQLHNKAIKVEDKVKKGDKVIIELGYDNDLNLEFMGYLLSLSEEDGSIKIECEDDIFLTRKPLKDEQLSNTTVKELLQKVAKPLNYKVQTNYSRGYDKFVIKNANGYDVLKKLQEECKLNIYIRNGVIYANPAELAESDNNLYFDFERNIETASLKYRKADEKDFEVTVEGIDKNGKRKKIQIGKEGGEKRHVIVTSWKSDEDLKARGETELKTLAYDGYEGDQTSWLRPFVLPGASARIVDKEYEYKKGDYFIKSIETEFGSSGASRRVSLGRKISNS